MQENLLKWIGGKHALAPFIIERMAPHNTYIELFAGAAHVFFQKPLASSNILNDINSYLTTMYKVIKNNEKRRRLIEELSDMFYCRDLFNYFKEGYYKGDFNWYTDVHKAAIFIYLNRVSFNGMFNSFSSRPDSTFVQTEIDKITKMMFNKLNAGKTVVENKDFLELLETYDLDNVLFYIDPPYWVTTTGKAKAYYEHTLDEKQHTALRDKLYKLKRAFWIMSYDDHPEIKYLYREINQNCIINTPLINQSSANASTARSESQTIYKSELLIANYNLKTVNTLFE